MKLLQTLLFPMLLAPTCALAEQVTCESRDGQQTECPMNTQGVVRVVRQLSKTSCIEGQNWGLFKHSVWVSGGCRAVFGSDGPANTPSYGGAPNYSGASSYGGATRGDAPTQVTCESKDGRRTECDMNTRGRVSVVRQLSKTACIEDRNWGLNRSSIWVDGGCRAVFALEGATGGSNPTRDEIAREDAQYNSSGRAPSAALRACNEFADQGYDGTVLSQNAMKPGWWEIVLRFEQYRYVCNVSSSGRVDSFDKIN